MDLQTSKLRIQKVSSPSHTTLGFSIITFFSELFKQNFVHILTLYPKHTCQAYLKSCLEIHFVARQFVESKTTEKWRYSEIMVKINTTKEYLVTKSPTSSNRMKLEYLISKLIKFPNLESVKISTFARLKQKADIRKMLVTATNWGCSSKATASGYSLPSFMNAAFL